MLTRRLGELALSYRHETIPADAREMAIRCILDATACSLAGLNEPAVVIVREEVTDQGGRAESTLLGSNLRVPAGGAALANGTAAHALDYDDVNLAIPGHATAVVMPAVLALGEAIGASGREMVVAFVAGYEIACRVGLLVAPGHYERGFHASSTVGAVGAAAACANLLKLSPVQTASALSLAATQASGLKALFGNMGKPLHAGLAARNGVLAARLAARGFDAGSVALEHPQGFGRAMSPDFKAEDALDESRDLLILANLFKYHAACNGVHAAIECGRALRERLPKGPASIARVLIKSNPASDKYCNIAAPSNAIEGKFSLRLNAALGLLGRDTSRLDAYSEDMVSAAEVVAVRDRVTVAFSGDLGMMESIMEVETTDGERLTTRYDAGCPETDRQAQAMRVKEKFRALVEPVLGAARAVRLREAILGLDAQDDASSLYAKI